MEASGCQESGAKLQEELFLPSCCQKVVVASAPSELQENTERSLSSSSDGRVLCISRTCGGHVCSCCRSCTDGSRLTYGSADKPTACMSGPSATALSTQRPVTTTSAPRSRQRRMGWALHTHRGASAAARAAERLGRRTPGRRSCCAASAAAAACPRRPPSGLPPCGPSEEGDMRPPGKTTRLNFHADDVTPAA